MSSNPTKDVKSDDEASSDIQTSTADAPVAQNFDNIDEKKLMRKIDFRLVPWLSILYLLSFLDRSAIGNARLFNMEDELQISDQQFNLAAAGELLIRYHFDQGN